MCRLLIRRHSAARQSRIHKHPTPPLDSTDSQRRLNSKVCLLRSMADSTDTYEGYECDSSSNAPAEFVASGTDATSGHTDAISVECETVSAHPEPAAAGQPTPGDGESRLASSPATGAADTKETDPLGALGDIPSTEIVEAARLMADCGLIHSKEELLLRVIATSPGSLATARSPRIMAATAARARQIVFAVRHARIREFGPAGGSDTDDTTSAAASSAGAFQSLPSSETADRGYGTDSVASAVVDLASRGEAAILEAAASAAALLPVGFFPRLDGMEAHDLARVRMAVVLRGVPGSGKSSIVRALREWAVAVCAARVHIGDSLCGYTMAATVGMPAGGFRDEVAGAITVCSGDYRMHDLAGNGTGGSFPRRHMYCFDANELTAAHRASQLAFEMAVRRGDAVVVSDNTNVQAKHFKAYIAAATSTAAERSDRPVVRLLRFDCPVDSEPLLQLLAGRNSHGVGIESCRRMRDALAAAPYSGKAGKEFCLPVSGAPDAVVAGEAGAEELVAELLEARRVAIAGSPIPPCPVLPAINNRNLLAAYLQPSSKAALAKWIASGMGSLPGLGTPIPREEAGTSRRDDGHSEAEAPRSGTAAASEAGAKDGDGWTTIPRKPRGSAAPRHAPATAPVARTSVVHTEDMEYVADHMTIVYRPTAIETAAAAIGSTVLLRPRLLVRSARGLVAVEVECLSAEEAASIVAASPSLLESTPKTSGVGEAVTLRGFGPRSAPAAPSANPCPHITVMKHKSVAAADSNLLLQAIRGTSGDRGSFLEAGTESPAAWVSASCVAGTVPVLAAVIGLSTGPSTHPATVFVADGTSATEFLRQRNIPAV